MDSLYIESLRAHMGIIKMWVIHYISVVDISERAYVQLVSIAAPNRSIWELTKSGTLNDRCKSRDKTRKLRDYSETKS